MGKDKTKKGSANGGDLGTAQQSGDFRGYRRLCKDGRKAKRRMLNEWWQAEAARVQEAVDKREPGAHFRGSKQLGSVFPRTAQTPVQTWHVFTSTGKVPRLPRGKARQGRAGQGRASHPRGLTQLVSWDRLGVSS